MSTLIMMVVAFTFRVCGQTFVFDLDSHKVIGCITNISGHGAAVDTESHKRTLP